MEIAITQSQVIIHLNSWQQQQQYGNVTIYDKILKYFRNVNVKDSNQELKESLRVNLN